MMYGGYGAGGPGMGGPSPSGLGGYGEASTRQRRPIEDLTEGKLFVGGLSYETTQQSFEDYCAQWGEIADAFVMDKKGFGFITFTNVEDAFSFLQHGAHTIDGRDVEVKAAVPKHRGGGARPTKKLFVGGVPRDIDTEEFEAHFAQYGAIEDAAIVSDGTGVSRGFGFVTYSDPLCIEKALIVKHVLRDRQVDCKRAVPKEDIANNGLRGPPGGMPGAYGMGDYENRGGRGGQFAGAPWYGQPAYGGQPSFNGQPSYGAGPSYGGQSPYAQGGYGSPVPGNYGDPVIASSMGPQFAAYGGGAYGTPAMRYPQGGAYADGQAGGGGGGYAHGGQHAGYRPSSGGGYAGPGAMRRQGYSQGQHPYQPY